jgi:hypothetical protein
MGLPRADQRLLPPPDYIAETGLGGLPGPSLASAAERHADVLPGGMALTL